jgi:hypothetical protein
LHPKEVGGAILSLDQADPAESWAWAGTDWRRHIRTSTVTTIAGVELQSADPEAMARRWAEVLGRPIDGGDRDGTAGRHGGAGRGGPSITLDEGVLCFVPDEDGRGEGVGGLELRATDWSRSGEQLLLCGTRVTLV